MSGVTIDNVQTYLSDRNVDMDLLDDVIANYFPQDRDQLILDLARAESGVRAMRSLLHNQPDDVGLFIEALYVKMLDMMCDVRPNRSII